jgi:16S rRNA processing protein RimM
MSSIISKKMSDWVEIGKIVAAQGLNGELRVYPNSDFPERFLEPGKRWLLKPGKTEYEPIKLLGGRYLQGKDLYVIKIAGVQDRNHAEELQGSVLYVTQRDRPHLEEDEFYVQDLIALEVFNQLTGELIGKVRDFLSAGNDLLEVEMVAKPEPTEEPQKAQPPGKKGKEKKSQVKTVLIPFVKEIVPIVDIKNGRIEIAPPVGLLEE